MENQLTNIKDLSVDERPRERLIKLGAAALSNTELIAIILRSGSQSSPLMTICGSLIDCLDDNMANLAALNVEQIAKVKGIGEIKAVTLLSAIELGKRSQRQTQPLRLKNDTDIEQLLKPYFTNDNTAQYHLVLINNRSELLATSPLDVERGKLPDLKNVIRLSLESGAAEIVLCRNEIKLPVRFCNQEKAYIIQLDAAASMLRIKMRGLLVINQ